MCFILEMHKYFEQEMEQMVREFSGLGDRHRLEDESLRPWTTVPPDQNPDSDRQLMLKDDGTEVIFFFLISYFYLVLKVYYIY